MTVTSITLRVPDPAAQAAFYVAAFGMQSEAGDAGSYRVGYGGPDATLVFVPGTPRAPCATDRYWKIALCMPNVDAAAARLARLGVPVSAPRQFREIGYLCHAQDPAGLTVELLQHTFGPRPEAETAALLTADGAFGCGAHLGLLTLRTADMDAEHAHWLSKGLDLVSVQPVPPGFTLYFYMHTADVPAAMPGDDVESVARRPWLWQRPTTVLEFKHDPTLGPLSAPRDSETGLAGFTLASARFDPSRG